MRYSLAALCCLTSATACISNSTSLQLPTATQVFQPRIDSSCHEPLPIVSGGIVDYIYFQDIEKLTQSSDLVVVGAYADG